jgi:hypothetical protein
LNDGWQPVEVVGVDHATDVAGLVSLLVLHNGVCG